MRLFDKKAALLFDQCIVSLANFSIGILLVRKSSLTNFGFFSLYWIVALFLAGISFSYIISPLLTNYFKKNTPARKVYLQYVYTLLLSFCVVFLCVGLLIAKLNDSVYMSGVLFCVTYVLYDGSRKLKFLLDKYIQVLVLDVFVYALVIGYLFYSTLLLDKFFLVFSACLILFSFTEIHFITNFKKNYFIRFIQHQHNNGKWLLYNNFSQWFNEPFYFTVSGYFIGPSAIGAIRVVQNFFGMCNVFIMFLESYLPIYLSKVQGEAKYSTYNKLMKVFFLFSSLACIFIVFLGAFFGSELIEYIYKDIVDDTFLYIIAYSLSYFFVVNVLVLKVILRNEGNSKGIFDSFTKVAFLNLVISLPIIHFFGATGVVIGISVGWFLTFTFLYKKCRGYFVK